MEDSSISRLSIMKYVSMFIMYFVLKAIFGLDGHDWDVFLKLTLFTSVLGIIFSVIALFSGSYSFYRVVMMIFSGLSTFYYCKVTFTEFEDSGTILRIYLIVTMIAMVCVSAFWLYSIVSSAGSLDE